MIPSYAYSLLFQRRFTSYHFCLVFEVLKCYMKMSSRSKKVCWPHVSGITCLFGHLFSGIRRWVSESKRVESKPPHLNSWIYDSFLSFFSIFSCVSSCTPAKIQSNNGNSPTPLSHLVNFTRLRRFGISLSKNGILLKRKFHYFTKVSSLWQKIHQNY